MSIRKAVSGSLATTFVLGIAAVASARQPPALTRAQAAADYAIACQGRSAQAGAGYRDSLRRFGSDRVALARTAKGGAGYRDSALRFGVTSTDVQVACAADPRLSASR